MKQIYIFALFVSVIAPCASWAGIPSVDFVTGKVAELSGIVDTKTSDEAVVKLTGNQTINGDKTFGGTVRLSASLADTANDNQAATTQWANARVAAAKGDIPVGGKDATTFTKIWIEE